VDCNIGCYIICSKIRLMIWKENLLIVKYTTNTWSLHTCCGFSPITTDHQSSGRREKARLSWHLCEEAHFACTFWQHSSRTFPEYIKAIVYSFCLWLSCDAFVHFPGRSCFIESNSYRLPTHFLPFHLLTFTSIKYSSSSSSYDSVQIWKCSIFAQSPFRYKASSLVLHLTGKRYHF